MPRAGHRSDIFPKPLEVFRASFSSFRKALVEICGGFTLPRDVGFTLAVLIGVPFGLFLGWYGWAYQAFNPMIQMRARFPDAWIPSPSFGSSHGQSAVFLIFLASVFPITFRPRLQCKTCNRLPARGPQFRPTQFQLFQPRHPAGHASANHHRHPHCPGGGVARGGGAEMIALTPASLLIIDARNAGKRYDLVVPAWS